MSLTKSDIRSLPKVMIHEHLDCSLRPLTMLELWDEVGFDKTRFPFPADLLSNWRDATAASGSAKRKLKRSVASAYQDYLAKFASQSLANYIKAIVDHILPVMQTREQLVRITKERIEDAVADGIIALELRFAPQLHTMGGLSLDEVMSAVREGLKDSSIPVKLILCSLRHENAQMASQLAALCLKNQDVVGVFDLAADEEANPGVLDWWLNEAVKVREASDHSIKLTIHLTETRASTDQERAILKKHRIKRIGHGIKDDWPTVLEVCPTSNVVTGQVPSFAKHPINTFFTEGKKVTVNTDGTLFTKVQLTDEYVKLARHFGWNSLQFLLVNLNALEASSFTFKEKQVLRARLIREYSAVIGSALKQAISPDHQNSVPPFSKSN